MARAARIVAPDFPHHVVQRGARGLQTFFDDDDYRAYLELLSEACDKHQVEIWAYCLMPNHVHLILTPKDQQGLARAVAQVHTSYARRVNKREGWQGHLWQSRFWSCPLDERHCIAAARYVETNPVRAKLAETSADWPWSSARAHIGGQLGANVRPCFMTDAIKDWEGFLAESENAEQISKLSMANKRGLPAGPDEFVEKLESVLDRSLVANPKGRPKRQR